MKIAPYVFGKVEDFCGYGTKMKRIVFCTGTTWQAEFAVKMKAAIVWTFPPKKLDFYLNLNRVPEFKIRTPLLGGYGKAQK